MSICNDVYVDVYFYIKRNSRYIINKNFRKLFYNRNRGGTSALKSLTRTK